ncbi:hypothetical protein [Kitasatospora phosalacinea]|uniref:hypothetical protein n=1 Tax=Kitasatospora phosalacinea TaxID=2065 RepID=UPI00052506E9|nr:hypothetical protein [Kitasatospora phosalacinea]
MRKAVRTLLPAGTALLLALAATACGTAEPKQQTAEVRTDAQLLAKCAALPAEADSVHWTYRTLGVQDSRVPGPTDRALDGLARLTPDGAARLRTTATWAPADHRPPAELAALLDRPVPTWLRTPALDGRSPSGAPHFLLDPDSDTLYFWAVNPHCAD